MPPYLAADALTGDGQDSSTIVVDDGAANNRVAQRLPTNWPRSQGLKVSIYDPRVELLYLIRMIRLQLVHIPALANQGGAESA